MIVIQPKSSTSVLIDRLLICPWLGMLALGALGDRLGIPALLHLGFFDVWLVVFALWAIIPTPSEFKKITWGE